jgi:hypothetical protein
MRFDDFARDILATPKHRRDELLGVSKPGPEAAELARLHNQPSVRYRQYEPPPPKEMNIGLSTKKKGK